MIIDMFYGNYSEPQPLRRMMEDVLTGEVLREFATLQELVTHGRPVASRQSHDVSAPPPRSEKKTDAQLLVELATNPDRQAARL